jgi:uncharacterized lipoprotein YmbA
MIHKPAPSFLTISFVLLFLAGCADFSVLEPKADESRFFYLDYPGESEETLPSEDGPVIAIGPVTLARHLDQPRMVTYQADNEIQYAEYDRWAEPVDDNVSRLLIDYLNSLPDNWQSGLQRMIGNSAEYQVGFHLVRFGILEDGSAVLQVSWWITAGKDKQFAISERTFTSKASREDVTASVQALQAVVIDWGTVIARQIRELESEEGN